MTSFANPAAVVGVVRCPSAGGEASVRTVIQALHGDARFLLRSTKVPVNLAPGASRMASPGSARSRAPCRSPPAATRTTRDTAGSAPYAGVVCGVAGAAAVSPETPWLGEATDVELAIVIDPDPVAVEVLAVIVAVPALLPVTRPVLETVAMVVFELVQVTVPMETALPDELVSRATACVV